MKTISILGSGWLGLPLIKHFIGLGYAVNASTRSKERLIELASTGAKGFVLDIDSQTGEIDRFLDTDTLIINIPSKDLAGFHWLAAAIESSSLENVLLVSSTSVYQDVRRTLDESDSVFIQDGPLVHIEQRVMNLNQRACTVVRFGGLVGPKRHPGRFFKIGRVVQQPDSPVNLIHLSDCIGIINEIIRQPCWGEILNACAETHPTKRDFYTKYAKQALGTMPEFGESNPNVGKTISSEKLKQTLNYRFVYPDLMALEFDNCIDPS